jgi:hypothetical protein
MALSTSLINAANNLIDAFGNDATLYNISGATSARDDEGDLAVSDWGTSTTIKVVDGGGQGSELTRSIQGFETVGEDEKIIKASVTVAENDRLTYKSQEYRVIGVKAETIESVDVIKYIKIAEAASTTSW